MQINNYYLSYSMHLNKFLVVNKETGQTHSVWKSRQDANKMIKDLLGYKKHFETNVALQKLGASEVRKIK